MAVELHNAFLWTCEECGRDNFARTVTVDPANMLPVDREDYKDAVRAWGEGSPMVDVFCLMAPDTVTCGHCGVTVDVDMPDDFD